MRRRANHEGTVTWRPRDGRWRGDIMLDGRRVSFYGASRREVLDLFQRARKVRECGLPIGAGREPLAKFLNRWLEDCVKPRCRPRTYILYKQQIESHIVPALGAVPLEKLTPQDVQQKLIAAKTSAGLGGRTVRHIRAVLRSALTQAEKWLPVPRNVVKLADPPRRAKTEIGVFGVDHAKVF